MNKSQFGFVCSGMGWGGWGIAYSLVSKSLPTRWEEPFPSPADPHKIHLSSILSLSSAQPFPQICSTRSGFSTLHQELNAVLEKSTSQVGYVDVPFRWNWSTYSKMGYWRGFLVDLAELNAISAADVSNTDPGRSINAGNEASEGW